MTVSPTATWRDEPIEDAAAVTAARGQNPPCSGVNCRQKKRTPLSKARPQVAIRVSRRRDDACTRAHIACVSSDWSWQWWQCLMVGP